MKNINEEICVNIEKYAFVDKEEDGVTYWILKDNMCKNSKEYHSSLVERAKESFEKKFMIMEVLEQQ